MARTGLCPARPSPLFSVSGGIGFHLNWPELHVFAKASPAPHLHHLLQHEGVHILQNLFLLQDCWLIGFRRSQDGFSRQTSHLRVCGLHLLTIPGHLLLSGRGVSLAQPPRVDLKSLQMITQVANATANKTQTQRLAHLVQVDNTGVF